MIKLTTKANAACHAFIKQHLNPPSTDEQIEALVSDSLASLFALIDDQPWLTVCDTHTFNAIEARTSKDAYYLVLHASRQADDTWLIGTPTEFPVSEEYLKRRKQSEDVIVRQLMSL